MTPREAHTRILICEDSATYARALSSFLGYGGDLEVVGTCSSAEELMGSLPRLDADVERLTQIPGQPPSLLRPPSGCRFHPRCPYVMDICKTTEPGLEPAQHDPTHRQACHLDQATKDREAAKLLAATMAEAG